jgi:6,7-dimethyl-8-ribityllumazine synthase
VATDHTNLSEYDRDSLPDASHLEIGLVVSEWNAEITDSLYKAAYKTLVDCGVWENNIHKMDVPGSFELIMGSKRMMEAHKPDAIIAIGSVIQGETRHFDFVCQAVAHGIKDLNVSTDTPVIFCVLTDDTLQQAQDRSGGKHGNKGVEAAIAAIRMATL